MSALFEEHEDQLEKPGLGDESHPEHSESAIPLAVVDHQPLAGPATEAGAVPLPTDRALALSDVIAPRSSAGEALIRLAYRLGMPGHAIASPLRRPAKTRILATVESPLIGDRTVGVSLRAGHFLIHGVKTPIAQVEFDSGARLSPGLEQAIHRFSWLRDLVASAPRADCASTAQRITSLWLGANGAPAKGVAWNVGMTGHRLLSWIIHAPVLLDGSDGKLKPRLLEAIDKTARWLDKKVNGASAADAVAGWCALTAAGLLLPQGKPRRLFAEAGLIHALGDLVAEDGGVLSRCAADQMDAIALLTDLLACYEAAQCAAPAALEVMRELLVPPLLALRHGDGALGSWQGQGAVGADRVAALIDATGVRMRPLKDVQQWGFQRLRGDRTVIQFDAAPPPHARHAQCGCASTLAFEMSDGAHRLIVNCGGAAMAGGLVPARIGQGLRATAAHSTLVLDDANSTAIQLHGKTGKGVELVELDRSTLQKGGREAVCVEASHDGYAARFGLKHRRALTLGPDGTELSGQDLLLPVSRKGKRGKIGFAIRFHLGRSVEAHLSDDERGASLLLPDGTLWQFRMAGDAGDAELVIEDSLWVDGEGRPHPTEQLVIQGMTSRGGGEFSWLFKKMG